MQIICDTHIPLFWANAPSRLSRSAAAALEKGRQDGQLAIADISFGRSPFCMNAVVFGFLMMCQLLNISPVFFKL